MPPFSLVNSLHEAAMKEIVTERINWVIIESDNPDSWPSPKDHSTQLYLVRPYPTHDDRHRPVRPQGLQVPGRQHAFPRQPVGQMEVTG